MAKILHQLIGSLSHYLHGFIHPRWCRISSINSSNHFGHKHFDWKPMTPGDVLVPVLQHLRLRKHSLVPRPGAENWTAREEKPTYLRVPPGWISGYIIEIQGVVSWKGCKKIKSEQTTKHHSQKSKSCKLQIILAPNSPTKWASSPPTSRANLVITSFIRVITPVAHL